MSYCHSRLAKRRILYTDSIEGGQQAGRDDLWAVTSAELNQAADVHRRLWEALVLIEGIASGSTSANSLPHIAKIAVAAFTGEKLAPLAPMRWQERCDWTSSLPAVGLMVKAMKEEIAELRAALASGFRGGRNAQANSAESSATGSAAAPADRQGEREGMEQAAKALGERAAGHYRNGDYELQDECLQCASMIRDMKPIPTGNGDTDKGEGDA